jgi:hypothetical protein
VTLCRTSARAYRRLGLGLGLAALAALFGAACGSSGNGTTTPSGSTTVTSFERSATASDGTTAVSQSGAPPAPNGGPSITVTAPTTVVSGTNTVVRIQSTQPFATVFAFVDGVDGFLKLSLKAPTTDTTLVVTLASSIPNPTFTADYRVAAQSGAVGISATVTTVASASTSPSANITGTWAVTSGPNFSFTQNGANVTGSETIPPIPPTPGVTVSVTSAVSGTVSGSVFTATNVLTASASGSGQSATCSETDGLVLQVSGNSMTGTYSPGTLTCTGTGVPGLAIPPSMPFAVTFIKQ